MSHFFLSRGIQCGCERTDCAHKPGGCDQIAHFEVEGCGLKLYACDGCCAKFDAEVEDEPPTRAQYLFEMGFRDEAREDARGW